MKKRRVELTPAEQVEQEKVKRAAECAREISAVLERFGCTLAPVVTIEGGRVTGAVRVVAG